MDSERKLLLGLIAALLVAGGLSWSSYLRPSLEVQPEILRGLPLILPHWRGRDIPIDGGVEEMLAADFNVQRSYVHPSGDVVWFYVGYYGTERGGRPEHTPWVCYPSNGWEIVRRQVVRLDTPSERRANEILVERGGEQRLVHFWYQSRRSRDMLGGFDQALDRLLGRLQGGRADGSLVRLSTPLHGPSDEAGARSRLAAFGAEILPRLVDHWPSEAPAS
ncbi:MAG: exosortase C-terminal domain/associated protein EpsI [Myxococcota bacterium]